jgi:branched-chain amino acid transport system permease protein
MSRLAVALGTAAVCVAGVVLALLPSHVSQFHLYQGAAVGFYLIALVGLDIVTGWTGQISLGHSAFMMIGGYTTAILAGRHGMNVLATIPLAALVAGLAGLAFGLPALRLSGLYLSLATFALALAVPSLAKKFSHFTGGTSGILLPLKSDLWYFRLSWICAGILFVVAWLTLYGPLGRTFRAVRDSEIAAASSGINLALYKTVAFGWSSAYAGVAGSLLAIWAGYANPGEFPFTLSLVLLVGLAVSIMGSLWGVIVGAVFVEFLPVEAQRISGQAPGLVQGIVLILVMLLLPAVGEVRRRFAELRAR